MNKPKRLISATAAETKDLTKLLCDILSTYSSYLMDDVLYPAIMDRIHSLDKPDLPFNVDAIFEHMYRLKEDMIDERNK